MKCGFCERPLTSLTAICDCGHDPNAGWIMNGRYQLLGLVGQGGMGMIYRALDQADKNKLCAIKISRWCEALQQLRQMEPEAAKREEQSRIEREFKLLQKAASRSSHIVQVFHTFQVDPRLGLYYPMEFLEGEPLANIPEWGQPMPAELVVDLILQLCEGVGIAHGLGVAHRDLNPENIFIVRTPESERFVKLIDFGIARDLYARKGIYNTGSDLAFGHLQYLSPEQVGYDPVTDEYQRETAAQLDHRADIYSIGAMMFQMLTGRPPFDDNTIEGLATRSWRKPPHLAEAIKEGTLPHELQELIMSCLQPAPNLRLPDILALSDLLQRYLNGKRSEKEFDALVEHASHTTEISEEDEVFTNFDDASWEFPAIQETPWRVPSSSDSLNSTPELSIFSKEFDSLFAEDEKPSDLLGEFPPQTPSGTLEITPPPIPGAAPPPIPGAAPPPISGATPPPIPPTLETPPPSPKGSFAGSTLAPDHGNGRLSPSKEPSASIPTAVWNSLDNAPAFVDFDDPEPANNQPGIVEDHNLLNVNEFFEGVVSIVEEHGEVLRNRGKGSPSIYGLPSRSPQLESLLSLDSLDVAAPGPTPQMSSDELLASELLTMMEEITIEEEPTPPPTPPQRTSSASWKRFTPSSHELPATKPSEIDPFRSQESAEHAQALSATPPAEPNLMPSAEHISVATQQPKSKTWLWLIIALVILGLGLLLPVFFV